ncbi:three-helix bundle dimerization domain-containing protein [Streptomyces mirabilis]|uniref:three-helix bundle dimerization domain-containing protein n=1 Tax=Streptomyces mirabilis TaxID=68239 RepID=UPI0033C7B708
MRWCGLTPIACPHPTTCPEERRARRDRLRRHLAVRNTPLTLAVKAVRRSPVVMDVREEGAIRAPADRLTAAYSAPRSPAEVKAAVAEAHASFEDGA